MIPVLPGTMAVLYDPWLYCMILVLPGTMGSPAFNKALAQNVAAEKVQMYGQVRMRHGSGFEPCLELIF